MRPEFEGIPDDEPVFVLRAQDRTAPAIVRIWMSLNRQVSAEKFSSALDTIAEMNRWPSKKAAD